jgi:hypothetical protein
MIPARPRSTAPDSAAQFSNKASSSCEICYAEITSSTGTMQAYEFSTTITPDGKLELPSQLRNLPHQSKVRVIVLIEEPLVEELPDDPSSEEIAASLRRALHEVEAGQTKPIAQLWDSIGEP